MKNKPHLLLFKIGATIVVVALLIYVFLRESNTVEGGILSSLGSFGIFGLIALIAAFFTAIAYYCRALEKCLLSIRPQNRLLRPRGVWLMFALPYNFIEDFFIIHSVSKSLALEAKTNPRLKGIRNFGMITGLSWCTAQIVSLIPTVFGQVATMIGLGLWLYHWYTIHKINKLLATPINSA